MPLALQGIQVCTAANKPTHAFTVVLPLCRHPKRKLQRYEAYQQLRREKSHAHSTHSPPWHTLSGDCEPVRSTGSHSGTGRQCRCINRNLCARRPGLCRSTSSSATTACRAPYATALCGVRTTPSRILWTTSSPPYSTRTLQARPKTPRSHALRAATPSSLKAMARAYRSRIIAAPGV
mgnify:FL=1